MKLSPFIIALKKYFEITQDMQGIYTENCITWEKEFFKDLKNGEIYQIHGLEDLN